MMNIEQIVKDMDSLIEENEKVVKNVQPFNGEMREMINKMRQSFQAPDPSHEAAIQQDALLQ